MHLLGERLKVPGENCPLAVERMRGTVSEGREEMSVVIIGGHERMERQYQEICRSYRLHCQSVYQRKRRDEEKNRLAGFTDLF